MQQWQASARPLIDRLTSSEEALVSVSEAPAVVVLAACDQLQAAVRHTQLWLQVNRCPDQEFGIYFVELISACLGMCAVMQMVAREAPEGQWIGNHDLVEKVATNLMDRIEQATRARLHLQQWYC
jgi:hypothetical protein